MTTKNVHFQINSFFIMSYRNTYFMRNHKAIMHRQNAE